MLELFNLKSNSRWNDTSFTSLLDFLNDMLREGNEIEEIVVSNREMISMRYLSPLIEDMKELWSPGVKMYDAFSGENSQLQVMIYCTISDFPAYGNLSGYDNQCSIY
ncbi:hypothetical protein LXL04_034953 [Taraxacum kok-saghyz]